MGKQSDWQEKLEEFFLKFPPLPKGGLRVLVKFVPWLALVGGIVGIIVVLLAFGVLSIVSPLMVLFGGMGTATHSFWTLIAVAISSVLLVAAYPGTKARKMRGWTLLFWSEAVSLLSALVSLQVLAILASLFVFYLLYQIKGYYK